MSDKKELLKELLTSKEFEDALDEGVEFKKCIITTYKEENKINYDLFFDIMLNANEKIKRLIQLPKKRRTNEDNELIKNFKSEIKALYSQCQNLLVEEKTEDNKKSKIQKIVEKIIPVILLLRYIGNNSLDKEFAKYGYNILGPTFEEKYEDLKAESKRKVISDIFNTAKNIKEKVINDNNKIAENIFSTKVPIELQYDKEMNPTALKPTDFAKLVTVKTKKDIAESEDSKNKISEKIEAMSAEKQFEAVRAELMRDSLLNIKL